ncbi:MAG TPA: pyridoxamine 5-phosphate oxidase, partial [Planctomycetes bacterium]|nr:pyridoxamine 5-phosphate oxidase [Planctomycetota bacterium]
MNQPQPQPVDPAAVRDLALQVVQEDRFPCLATVAGDQPRLRPVSPVKTDQFTVYVANLRSYQKTAEIEQNPRVELCYMSADHNQVRITGVAEVVQDRQLLE